MRVGIFGFQQTLVVGLCPFCEADQAIALRHLEADAVALFLVAADLAVGFLVAVGGLGVLLAAKGQVSILGWVSALGIDVGAHEDEQRRQHNQYVFSHRHKFSFLQTRQWRFYYRTKVQQFLEME